MSNKTRKAQALAIATTEEVGFQRPEEREMSSLGETKGIVFVEYVALLLLVTIMGAAAVASLGVPLVNLFRYQQMVLALPIP